METTKDAATDQDSDVLNAKEAAIYIGRKSPTAFRTMNRLARSGEIDAGWNGDEWRFEKQKLKSWMYKAAKRKKKRKTKASRG